MACLVDFAIVVNVVFCVVVRPESPVAVTSAVYVREFFNGRVGTQLDRSSRGSAGTCAPLSSVSRTAVIFPPATVAPTSALIGTPLVRSAGVRVTDGPAAAFFPCPGFAASRWPAVQAPMTNGVAAMVTANSVNRRLTSIFRTPFPVPLASFCTALLGPGRTFRGNGGRRGGNLVSGVPDR